MSSGVSDSSGTMSPTTAPGRGLGAPLTTTSETVLGLFGAGAGALAAGASAAEAAEVQAADAQASAAAPAAASRRARPRRSRSWDVTRRSSDHGQSRGRFKGHQLYGQNLDRNISRRSPDSSTLTRNASQ